MLRRALNVASLLSLLVALLLAIGSLTYTPGRGWWIGDVGHGWAMMVLNGIVDIDHGTRTVASASVGTLAIAFALLPLPWVVVLYRRQRRRWARGFPIEVPRHAPPKQPTANRGIEMPGREAGQTASGQPDSEG